MSDENNKENLRNMLDNFIQQDMDAAKASFHDFMVNKSREILNKDDGSEEINFDEDEFVDPDDEIE